MTKIINGNHVVDGPLTTSLTEQVQPGLLRNEIDSRIVKVRPSATPLDQISRLAGTRRAGAMTVEYYSVDTKPTEATLKDVNGRPTGHTLLTLTTSNDLLFEPSETILVPGSLNSANEQIVLYVVERPLEGGVKVMAVNVDDSESFDLEEGQLLVRMGRAATELDVQTPQFEALPVKASNYCQIFKAQIEQSTLQKLSNKEVGWTFTDQEEVAVIDMRLGMEKSFLFGVRGRLTDPVKKEDVMLTAGVWNQTKNTFTYSPDDVLTDDFVVDLTRRAFTGNAGSRRKVLIAGSALIDALNKMDHTRVVGATDTVTRWGIDFTELRSKFGSLYVVHSEVFDHCGAPGNGMVIDPQYLTKYSFIPMGAEKLDLKRSGQRNTDAVVITEASCLVLRYPEAHMRIVAQ